MRGDVIMNAQTDFISTPILTFAPRSLPPRCLVTTSLPDRKWTADRFRSPGTRGIGLFGVNRDAGGPSEKARERQRESVKKRANILECSSCFEVALDDQFWDQRAHRVFFSFYSLIFIPIED